MEQRTEAWHLARCGKVTGSRIADVVARTKSGYAASRENLKATLIVERLTQKPSETFTNAAMEWGTQQEPIARAAYAARTGQLVDEVGFINHPTIEWAGASPDGVIGNALVEFKCPNTATHLEYVLSKQIPQKYVYQMQFQMAVTGAESCDFVSFDPRLPERYQMLILPVKRDNTLILMLEDETRKFLMELETTLADLERIEL
jgi:putative phage-type endonuclease